MAHGCNVWRGTHRGRPAATPTRLPQPSIFAGCSEEQLQEIDRLADEVHVEAGRTVLRQGDLGQEFALIVDGEADVIKDGETVARPDQVPT
ncbi:MAG: hypothetical protein R2716_09360 [Microthrixaceae bacterium]